VPDVLQFFSTCVKSGIIFLSACSLFIVPLSAWAALRFALPTLRRMGADSRWQASLAAAAAIVPGSLVIALAGAGLFTSLGSDCLQTLTGRILYAVVALALACSIIRATALAIQRNYQARSLVQATVAPTARLAKIGRDTGVSVRELKSDEAFCALALVRKSVVVVSSATLESLSDAELEAALFHERGHARHGDQITALILTFFVDLLPLPAAEFVSLYRDAREFAADQHALYRSAPEDLAGALLTFARGQRQVAHCAALPGETGLRRRLERLIGKPVASEPISIANRVVVASIVGVVMLVGLAPVGAPFITPLPCNHASVSARV
jgi:Zn-dependent protease with chaperone function